MLQKRKKHKLSTGQQKMKDVSEAFQQNLLRDIKLDSPFREHQMTIEQLVDIYPLSRINHIQPTKSVGLNDDEAEIKLSSATEKNVIYPKNRKGGKFQAFLHQFKNTFRILLLIATFLCFLIFALDQSRTKELAMGIILAVVLIVMCFISYYEELNTFKQISTFQSMIAIDCTVIRCGRKIIIPSSDLIIGDLVWIQNGDRIPADMRLIYCDDLQVETSWLSGENA
uniref:Cation-transporting P-type ATPase N-terminal domain-containing protein n=1 Tax=Panagrolaimus davidi TaxID=227884 RepID=A0A914Q1L9_9BILA